MGGQNYNTSNINEYDSEGNRIGQTNDKGVNIVVDAGNGIDVEYMHLQSTENLKVGMRIQRGQLLAKSGNSGYSFGPHLHLATKKDGNVFNPLFYNQTLNTVDNFELRKDQLHFYDPEKDNPKSFQFRLPFSPNVYQGPEIPPNYPNHQTEFNDFSTYQFGNEPIIGPVFPPGYKWKK